jgi:hypothetical protein
MRTLESGAGERVMEWCLGSSVGQKSSIKIEHAEETTELTGGLRRGSVLKMGLSSRSKDELADRLSVAI